MTDTPSPVAGGASEASRTDSLHAAVLGTSFTCIILVSIFTSARFIAKRSVSSYHVEDYLLMITWPMLVGFTIALIISANQGVGDHIWNVPADGLPKIAKTDYVIDVFYAPTTWVAKTALLFQMQRIFCPTRQGFVYIACYVLAASVAITYSVVSLALILQCSPVKKAWDPTVTGGHCLDEVAMSSSTGVINVVTDFLILALPMWAIWHLKMPLKRKFTISVIFATGLIACACSLCRMVYAFQITQSPDFTYTIAKLGISAVCEITSIILCTCFPLMPRFMHVCQNTQRGSQIFSFVFPRSTLNKSNDTSGKILTDDSCMFCDEYASCAVHQASTNLGISCLELGSASNSATAASLTNERRDSDATRVEETNLHPQKDRSIVIHQSFEVKHGVNLKNQTKQQSIEF